VVPTRILHHGGLDRYHGLLDVALESGLVKKAGHRYEFPDGQKVFEKNIQENPENFWTQELLEQLNTYVGPQFSYQS
jgi:hypothetical protein